MTPWQPQLFKIRTKEMRLNSFNMTRKSSYACCVLVSGKITLFHCDFEFRTIKSLSCQYECVWLRSFVLKKSCLAQVKVTVFYTDCIFLFFWREMSRWWKTIFFVLFFVFCRLSNRWHQIQNGNPIRKHKHEFPQTKQNKTKNSYSKKDET